jgi:hypothetical protein
VRFAPGLGFLMSHGIGTHSTGVTPRPCNGCRSLFLGEFARLRISQFIGPSDFT